MCATLTFKVLTNLGNEIGIYVGRCLLELTGLQGHPLIKEDGFEKCHTCGGHSSAFGGSTLRQNFTAKITA
jgi:hypothetical protein